MTGRGSFNESLLTINHCPIIAGLMRRFHTPRLVVGLNPLDARQGKHARDVLRLEEGTEVELFDDAGKTAQGILIFEKGKAAIRVIELADVPEISVKLTIASAIPKGERADWMVEKLSELGVAAYVPLIAERSVAAASGENKLERWRRIAVESAKQCRRSGVMRIDQPRELLDCLAAPLPELGGRICLTTERPAKGLSSIMIGFQDAVDLTVFVGPEGGWTETELDAFVKSNTEFVRLTDTILRIETAAIAATAIIKTAM